ncbi:hypothetical protein ACFFX0_14055 [Citricoccus parietis]|uniref:Uncharacterized protein n=1 Tax=Citricoccus parietis TaxID=592307 RepID=A0ABV5FZZ8_9MICC
MVLPAHGRPVRRSPPPHSAPGHRSRHPPRGRRPLAGAAGRRGRAGRRRRRRGRRAHRVRPIGGVRALLPLRRRARRTRRRPCPAGLHQRCRPGGAATGRGRHSRGHGPGVHRSHGAGDGGPRRNLRRTLRRPFAVPTLGP